MAATATTAAAAAQDASSSATSTTTSTDHPYLVTFIPLNPPGAPSSSTSHTRRIVNLEHPVSIGRLLDKDEPDFRGLKFASKVVSRRHAVMGFLDRKLYIQDTSSSSGTFLNSKRLSPQGTESGKVEVRDGDVIRLGEECEVNGVVHQAVTLKVALGNVTALKGRESQPGRHPSEDSDNYIDLSTNPLIQHAVDSEFTLIWSSLTRGLDHPLKKLRDAAGTGDSGGGGVGGDSGECGEEF
ncbi:uncharacterized protein EV422DRAFT_16169 [Fimicolochytrium jonesii]|uniref:uncharacterized protein n=1 Tax=Fimicolochytrium jonesii TaxID=1396493 RepID=UPI0022FEA50C|nr:uncharacterized protein EV422DRAFT_16169 [Fimicolochytrium jonesii]KAI8826879.1 hypothetical protein EV422DRAFT_16169 [Fimicolochytrium jonesii]